MNESIREPYHAIETAGNTRLFKYRTTLLIILIIRQISRNVLHVGSRAGRRVRYFKKTKILILQREVIDTTRPGAATTNP